MSDTLWIITSRSLPASSTPMLKAAPMATRKPNSVNATSTARSVKIVRTLRRNSVRQSSGRYFMRPAPR